MDTTTTFSSHPKVASIHLTSRLNVTQKQYINVNEDQINQQNENLDGNISNIQSEPSKCGSLRSLFFNQQNKNESLKTQIKQNDANNSIVSNENINDILDGSSQIPQNNSNNDSKNVLNSNNDSKNVLNNNNNSGKDIKGKDESDSRNYSDLNFAYKKSSSWLPWSPDFFIWSPTNHARARFAEARLLARFPLFVPSTSSNYLNSNHGGHIYPTSEDGDTIVYDASSTSFVESEDPALEVDAKMSKLLEAKAAGDDVLEAAQELTTAKNDSKIAPTIGNFKNKNIEDIPKSKSQTITYDLGNQKISYKDNSFVFDFVNDHKDINDNTNADNYSSVDLDSLTKFRSIKSKTNQVLARLGLVKIDDNKDNLINTLIIERTDNASIAKEEEPPKNVLVMTHGYGAGIGFFYRNFGMISELDGWRTYSIDWLGMANSGRPKFPKKNKNESVESVVQKTEDFFIDSLEEWRKVNKIDKFTLLGHSLGGYLSSCYAMKYPDRVEKLILVSPAGFGNQPPDFEKQFSSLGFIPKVLIGMWSNMWDFSPMQIVRSAGPFGPKLVKGYTNRRFAYLEEKERSDFHSYLYHISSHDGCGEYALTRLLIPGAFARVSLSDRISKIKCPITFLYGANDWMKYEHAMDLVKNIPNDRLRIGLIQHAGHHLYADNHVSYNMALSEELDEVLRNKSIENNNYHWKPYRNAPPSWVKTSKNYTYGIKYTYLSKSSIKSLD